MFRSLLIVGLIIGFAPAAFCGPPFLTDDPQPVDFRHYEFYVFSTLDRSPDGYGIVVPAFEFNIGAAPNLQLHVVAPLQLLVPTDDRTRYGAGDLEVGAKYRFIQESRSVPQIGVFPLLELPSGNAQAGLGNGRLWAKLPVWIQKSWGKWTSYGGGGYVLNDAPGMRNHPFGGWQVQREINEKLTVGAEWFGSGADALGSSNSQITNFGGFYNFNQNFSLLFTAGHTVSGEPHTVAYVGLYWTWGKDRAGGSSGPPLNSGMFSDGRRQLRP
jgi:hypothetical protein